MELDLSTREIPYGGQYQEYIVTELAHCYYWSRLEKAFAFFKSELGQACQHYLSGWIRGLRRAEDDQSDMQIQMAGGTPQEPTPWSKSKGPGTFA